MCMQSTGFVLYTTQLPEAVHAGSWLLLEQVSLTSPHSVKHVRQTGRLGQLYLSASAEFEAGVATLHASNGPSQYTSTPEI